MKCINFGKFDKKLLIPVVGGLIVLCYKYIVKYNPKYGILTENPFLYNIYVAIGMILAFIPYVIIKCRSKNSSDSSNKAINKAKLDNKLLFDDQDIFKKKKFARIRFIFYSTIFDFAQTLLYTFFALNNSFNLWNFDILLFSVFSYLMLKTKLYRHQYISIISIIILGIFLNINEAFKTDTKNTSGAFEITMIFVSEICFSLLIVIEKYNMEKNYCSPYQICIGIGIIEFILNLIILISFNLADLKIEGIQDPKKFPEYFNNFDYNDLIVCFTIIIALFFFNISLLLTCDYFSPCHTLIIYIVKDCSLYLRPCENVVLNILSFLILILIAFAILVYIEIIEINIFKVSYNTKKNIEIRSERESLIEFRHLLPSNEEEEEIEDEEKKEEEKKEDDDISAETTFSLIYKKKH